MVRGWKVTPTGRKIPRRLRHSVEISNHFRLALIDADREWGPAVCQLQKDGRILVPKPIGELYVAWVSPTGTSPVVELTSFTVAKLAMAAFLEEWRAFSGGA